MTLDQRLWLAMGTLTAAIDGIMMHRRLSGKMGPQVRARYMANADRIGGIRNLAAFELVACLIAWPLGLPACALSYAMDRRRR